MTRDEIVDNLGTIARSGSQNFVKNLKEADTSAGESIIGQFGVGFYSSFIVADSVEVLSKSDGHKGVRWVSDGTVRSHSFKNFNINLIDVSPCFRVITRSQMQKTCISIVELRSF